MYLIGETLYNLDYDFCENIDFSFIEDYEPNFKKYKKSLTTYATKNDITLFPMSSYEDINNGENDDVYIKLCHFIDTYFTTKLQFYTQPYTEEYCNNEPVLLGIICANESEITEIKENFDMETYNKILSLLNIDTTHNNISVYDLDKLYDDSDYDGDCDDSDSDCN
jgi:hypothetical protein